MGGEAGPNHLYTALRWLLRFVDTFPSRQLSVPHVVSGDVHAARYNEATLLVLGEFIRQRGSVRPGHEGEVVSALSIADELSALRANRSTQEGYNLLVSGVNLRLPRQMQQMCREDCPAGWRSLARGLTAREFSENWSSSGLLSGGHAMSGCDGPLCRRRTICY